MTPAGTRCRLRVRHHLRVDAVESYRERAPRLRLAALVVVGVLVLGLVAFAVVRANPKVTGGLVVGGRLCVTLDNRVWRSVETFEPDQGGQLVQGSWTETGDRTATFTTPSGRVVAMSAAMPPADARLDVSCAIA